MLKVIDLKIGNIGSVIKAVKHLETNFELISTPECLEGATGIILPGVGNFSVASERLFASGFADALDEYVCKQSIPFLGICVGMQLLAKSGEEGGVISSGLGYFDANVKRLNNFSGKLVVPHMGWNDVSSGGNYLFQGVPESECFYFVHSYAMKFNNTQGVSIAYTDYGENVVAYVNKENIHGAQFHPEKSQAVGLQFLRNFIELC